MGFATEPETRSRWKRRIFPSMKKTNAGALLIALSALILAGCDNPVTSSSTQSTEGGSSITSLPDGSGSSSSSSISTSSSSSSSSSSSEPDPEPVIDPAELLADALTKDYSNWFGNLYEAVDGTDTAAYDIYRYDGYTIVYDPYLAEMYGDTITYQDCFDFFHDYEGESYRYLEDNGNGPGWLATGYHNIPLGFDNIYFEIEEAIEALKTLTAEEYTYAYGIYYVTDAEAVERILPQVFNYSTLGALDLNTFSFQIDQNGYFCDFFSAYDDGTDDVGTYVEACYEDFGSTAAPQYVEVPAAPTEDTIRDYYEDYTDEPQWYDIRVESIDISVEEKTEIELRLDETAVISMSYLPANATVFLFSAASSDEGVATVDYNNDGDFLITAVNAGEATITVTDLMEEISSNTITVTVIDDRFPTRTDIVNDLYFDTINGTTGSFELYDALSDDGTANLSMTPIDLENTSLTYPLSSHDNTFDSESEQIAIFEMGEINHSRAGFVIEYEEGSSADGIAFRYGLPFEDHESNLGWMTPVNPEPDSEYGVHTYVSNDGVDYVEADDWTEEFVANANGHNLSLYECDFDAAYRYIKVEFYSYYLGKPIWVGIQNVKLYHAA